MKKVVEMHRSIESYFLDQIQFLDEEKNQFEVLAAISSEE